MFTPPPVEYVAESWRRWHAKAREAASEAASAAKKAAETCPDTEPATAAPNTVHHAGCLSLLTPPSHSHADCALASFFRLQPESDSEHSALSFADSPPHRRRKLQHGDQHTELLRAKKRKAQMRLVSLRRGHVKARSGEPRCLEAFVADLGTALQQPRGQCGRFATHKG